MATYDLKINRAKSCAPWRWIRSTWPSPGNRGSLRSQWAPNTKLSVSRSVLHSGYDTGWLPPPVLAKSCIRNCAGPESTLRQDFLRQRSPCSKSVTNHDVPQPVRLAAKQVHTATGRSTAELQSCTPLTKSTRTWPANGNTCCVRPDWRIKAAIKTAANSGTFLIRQRKPARVRTTYGRRPLSNGLDWPVVNDDRV